MSKIGDVQLRSKAAILAEEGYSYSVIGDKLGRSNGWLAKWLERSKQGELGDRARCGRPKILTQAAIQIIKKAKYRRGFGLRQIEKSLKAGGLKGNKRNNQKLHESGVEVEMLETQKGAVANRRSEEKMVVIR